MKNKARKMAEKVKKIENPIIAMITINTDDDFYVNDVFYIQKELEFETIEDLKKGVFDYFSTLKFKPFKGTEYRLEGFLEQVHSEMFKESVSQLGDVILSGTPYEWKVDEANAGGNQTIQVKVLK